MIVGTRGRGVEMREVRACQTPSLGADRMVLPVPWSQDMVKTGRCGWGSMMGKHMFSQIGHALCCGAATVRPRNNNLRRILAPPSASNNMEIVCRTETDMHVLPYGATTN
jgi:hypothetical protein